MSEVTISFKEGADVSESDLKFLGSLQKENKVIFDWGGDSLWVVEGEDETNEKNLSVINADKFHEATGIPAITSADTVVSLLNHGIEVEVRNFQSSLDSQPRIDQLTSDLAQKLEVTLN